MNKAQVRQETYRALSEGSLEWRDACEECGRTSNVVIHHEDYADPLKIRWLCKRHHAQLHNWLAPRVNLTTSERVALDALAERTAEPIKDLIRRVVVEHLEREKETA